MILTSDTGEAKVFRIGMRLDNTAFTPGEAYNLTFTLKALRSDADEDAKVQKRTGGYGITVSGSVALVAFTYIDTAGGTVGEVVVPPLAAGDYFWDIRSQLIASPYTSRIVRSGTFTLNQAITQGLDTSVTIYTSNPPAGSGGGTTITFWSNGIISVTNPEDGADVRFLTTSATNPLP